MSYEVITADRRLCTLRALDDCGGSGNESVIQECVNLYGHNVSRDWVRTNLEWLAEQGLLVVKDISGITVATLTHRGYDLIAGQVTVPGVKKARRT